MKLHSFEILMRLYSQWCKMNHRKIKTNVMICTNTGNKKLHTYYSSV